MTNSIGVGIIGASPGPASWAANAHIPAVAAVDGVHLRAVATSKRASADAAEAAYGVRAYDQASSLIADPAVDVVVVAVNVGSHKELITEAIAAGKIVYSEWPLAVTTDDARFLATAAEAAGVRTVVGLQSRYSPAISRLRELVVAEMFGRVMGTSLIGSGMAWGPTTDTAHRYMFDKASGANTLTVPTAHALDALMSVLGDIDSIRGEMAIGRDTVHVIDDDTTRPVTAPDQVALSLKLKSGAVGSVFYRGGLSRAGNLRWEINGYAADALLTTPTANGNIQATELSLAIGDGEAGSVAPVDVAVPGELESLPVHARALAGLYTAFVSDLANGTSDVPDFEYAVRLHELLDQIEP